MQNRKSLTLNDDAQASLPGNLDVQYLLWLRCFPREPLTYAAYLAGALLLALFIGPLFWLPVALMLAVAVFSAIRIKEHFRSGCINPACVVSLNPPLIAAYTDLTTGRAPWPVVKVLPHPLHRMHGGAPAVGTRLVVVALYSGEMGKPHWDDFDPIVANCVTRNEAAIEKAFSRLSEENWSDLKIGLQQVPQPYKLGLYPVRVSSQNQTSP